MFCNQFMIFDHYRHHFKQCKQKNLNFFNFGSFEENALGTILDISNTSMDNVAENHDKTYNCGKMTPSSKNLSNSTAGNSSGEEFIIHKAPNYLPQYNETRKIRKEILNFVNELEAKHDISKEDVVLNILDVVSKNYDSEEVFSKFGYIKIQNVISYSKNLR